MQDQAALLKRAIIQGVSERYERELCACKAQVRCSDAHMEKMSEILGVDVRSINKRSTRKVVIAALLLAAALAIGSLTVYANRDKIREFFLQFYEDHIELEFSGGESPRGEFAENYVIGYMPEGYQLIRRIQYSSKIQYKWKNQNEKMVSFMQMDLDTDIRYSGNGENLTIIEHGEYQIIKVDYGHAVTYTWNDGKYILDIYDETYLPIEEIYKIIDSIHPKE